MSKLKKMISFVSALVCVGMLSLPVTTSAFDDAEMPIQEDTGSNDRAITYDPCDVNHDGYVDYFDVMRINNFLNGSVHVTNYSVLDADRNMIVDGADAEYVAQRAVGNTSYSGKFISRTYNGSSVTEVQIPYQLYSGTYYDSDTSATTSRAYRKYTYSSGSIINYSLTPISPITTNSGSNCIDAIVDGTDNQYHTALPENSGIVRIKVSNNGNNPCCYTGFIVGNHQIATAASNLMNGSSFYNTVEVRTYSNSGALTNTTLTAIAAHVPSLYNTGNDSGQYNYALITVEQDLQTYPHFAIGNTYNLSTYNYNHIPVYVTGGLFMFQGSLRTAMGNLSSTNNYTTKILRHNVDTLTGQEGAPTYTVIKDTNNEYYYTALGINSGETSTYNKSVRFTKYHKQFYLNNPYA